MKKEIVRRESIKLMGITTRTDNTQIFSSNPKNNKIAATVQKYFHQQLAEKIPHRKNSGTTFCVYTNYQSDHTGEYTYFIGEEVSSEAKAIQEFEILTIPPQTYIKFTNKSGPMPMYASICGKTFGLLMHRNLAESVLILPILKFIVNAAKIIKMSF
jgi:predicted transcriptional regulator YdeE